jgi:glycosyltransferase involved in cell wall biosynthesis
MIHYITTNGLGNAWVANELNRLRMMGVDYHLHSMRAPKTIFFKSEWAIELNKNTEVIYPFSVPRLLLSAILAPFIFRSRFFQSLSNALFSPKESPRNHLAVVFHFLIACDWAIRNQNNDVSHIHSQWIHSCGTIAMYSAWLLGVGFSFTGHAADLFRERVALKDKIKRADKIICISEFHRQFFLEEGASPTQLFFVYCGIDLKMFTPKEKVDFSGRVHILSAGRLVEKKGFAELIRACRILKDNKVNFKCTIGGSGTLEQELRDLIRELDLEDCVVMTGQELKQEDIPEFMWSGDLFCLPCVWARDNDVDGLPQMLVEAMACGVPVISTRLVGIPDLIKDKMTGVLVEPREPSQIAEAIEYLIEHPSAAEEYRQAGLRMVDERFNLETCLNPLADYFKQVSGRFAKN